MDKKLNKIEDLFDDAFDDGFGLSDDIVNEREKAERFEKEKNQKGLTGNKDLGEYIDPVKIQGIKDLSILSLVQKKPKKEGKYITIYLNDYKLKQREELEKVLKQMGYEKPKDGDIYAKGVEALKNIFTQYIKEEK